jgi:four helix bundle protein
MVELKLASQKYPMEPSKSFTELIVWQKAHQFVLKTYLLTQSFPKEEIYGLSHQFRRAALSIAANIAEGYSRRGDSDKCRFLNISQSSLQECKYFLILSRDLNYKWILR